MKESTSTRPPQEQEQQPGREHKMHPLPVYIRDDYRGADKLKNKVALITGGDSGIGRAVAVHFAREGADVSIIYLEESEDAETVEQLVQKEGRRCLRLEGDIGEESFCRKAVEETVNYFGRLDILVNNAAEQHVREEIDDITPDDLVRIFKTNLFSQIYLIQHSLPHLSEGSCIVNCTSVTAFRGSPGLLDYSATKGAILALTRSLAQRLVDRKIRVNAVAPGPIWTPLIPASMPKEKVRNFGKNVPMQRPGEPWEVATCFVFLASSDSSYMTGQTLHPNGGEMVGT